MNHQWQPPMPRNPEFDQFLAAQKAGKNKHGNLTDRKAQWIEKLDTLYALVDQSLAPYFADGSMERSISRLQGSYGSQSCSLHAHRSNPIGSSGSCRSGWYAW